MDGVFANLHNSIINRIEAMLAKTDIRYIDQDLGQLENYDPTKGGKPRVTWPCALLDMENFTFDDEGEHTQRAEGNILIRLGFDAIEKTNSITPINYREKGLRYYDIEWRLHKALHQWSPGDGFGYLTRISAETEKREDLYRVRAIRYRLSFSDKSTLIPQNTTPSGIVID